MIDRKLWIAAGIGLSAAALMGVRRTRQRRDTAMMEPAGGPKSLQSAVLEAGSGVLQAMTPLRQFDMYMVGFHPMKDHPDIQMEVHHFCRQINEDLAQCVLFSGNSADSYLNGIEYIISERLYETLPEAERQYWHPHNYEILSGTLVAPGVPESAEHALLKKKINSYGKTWHTWNTGAVDQPGDSIPLGPALLAWSFNRDGELRECLLSEMEQSLGIDTTAKRQNRADLAQIAHAQEGVDDLRDAFPGSDGRPAGVRDKRDSVSL